MAKKKVLNNRVITTPRGKTLTSYEDWNSGGRGSVANNDSRTITSDSGVQIESYDSWKAKHQTYTTPVGSGVEVVNADKIRNRQQAIEDRKRNISASKAAQQRQNAQNYIRRFSSSAQRSPSYNTRLKSYLEAKNRGESQSFLDSSLRKLVDVGDITEAEATEIRNSRANLADIIADEENHDQIVANRYRTMISAMPDEDYQILLNADNDTMESGYMNHAALMQRGYTRDEIFNMIDTIRRDRNAEKSKKAVDWSYENTGKNIGTGILGFTGARVGNLAGAVTGSVQALGDSLTHYLYNSDYDSTDPNALGYLPSRMASAADSAISDSIEGENGNLLRKGAGFVYRGAANAADNLVRMAAATAIGGPAAGGMVNSAFSFTQGFQSSYREAQEKGGSPVQGLLMGSIDGGMEVFTESRTFERWMNLKDPELVGQGVYEWLKAFGRSIGNEITEEEASYIANTIADAYIMAEKGENSKEFMAMVADGKTPDEARWELTKKYAREMGMTALDTAMSTVLMNGVTGLIANHQYKKTYGGSARELVDEGLKSREGTASRGIAEKLQKKMDSGKELSGYDIRRMAQANEQEFEREEADGYSPEYDDEEEQEAQEEETVIWEAPKQESDPFSSSHENGTVTLDDLSKKYGDYAGAMKKNYLEGQNAEEYDRAFQIAFDMGKSGLNKSALSRLEALGSMQQSQREIAYEIGEAAAAAQAKAQSTENSKNANGKTGWRRGVVRGEGVKIADLTSSFNDPQRKAYSTLSTIAEATGIDIVLYKSEANSNGEFEGEQGRFEWKDNAIYIDVNAGLKYSKDVGNVAKYAMLRTYGHEFTHFIEKWNPEQYNEFRKAVFSTMDDANKLIETRLAQDSTGKMTYDDASREVVAEAMTDILEDSQFLQELAGRHPSVFETMKTKLKEFVENLKSYFKTLSKNGSREARQLKKEVGDSLTYLEDIVKKFDTVAVEAVENYQKTVAEDEAATDNEEAATDSEKEAVEEVQKADIEPVSEEKVEPKQEEITAKEHVKDFVDEKYGFTIHENAERGTVEISFTEKPDKTVLDALKQRKFRWSKTNKLWYGYGEQDDIADVIRNAKSSKVDNAPDKIEKQQEAIQNSESVEYEQTGNTPSEKAANEIIDRFLRKGVKLEAKDLYEIADRAFGGTQAEGKYNRKDAYDAMELAVNRYLLNEAKDYNGNAENAKAFVKKMQGLLSNLPTQTVRTQEQQDFQQFSTPPNIAYLAAWAADITKNDTVLEPSAGIGGLAVFAKAWGADVTVNELSQRRLEVLRSMGFDHIYNENAEQIDNILPDSVSPSVVIMNPPFSSTAGRTTSNKTSNAETHINQALARLRDNGRLVAILGKGMNDADYSRYWNEVRKKYNIRANLSIDGSNYTKYGTSWGVQLVVIDKTGPQSGETVTGTFKDILEIPGVLEGIRNDRIAESKRNTPVQEVHGVPSVSESERAVSDAAGELSDSAVGGKRASDGGRRGRTGTASDNSEQKQSGSVQDGDRSEQRRNGGRNVQHVTAVDISESAEKTDGQRENAGGRGTGGAVSENADGKSGLQRVRHEAEPARPDAVRNDDGVYASYVSPKLTVEGARKHPANLVESAAMAAVEMPKATYKPDIPKSIIENGDLSQEQLVSVTYAGQNHEQILPNGDRKGFFIGDGTGVGKGRTICGIILDNFNHGRRKAVWFSEKANLYDDAIRDWTQMAKGKKEDVISLSKIKTGNPIAAQEGILFSTYDTLKSGMSDSTGAKSRIQQIAQWLGKDFDGVIVFDEAHNLGNLLPVKGTRGTSKPSQKALAGNEIQKLFPKARIVYASATSATDVSGLAFASRLGLWGKGTAFSSVNEFVDKIGSAGIAAMELIVRDLKAQGSYVARSISYSDVQYDTIQHDLNDDQRYIYNEMSKAWQKTMESVEQNLVSTGGIHNSSAKQTALGQYYGALQRFYNQVLTSMSMPSVIQDMKTQLADGKSCVLQIVNTYQAAADRQIASIKAAGGSLDEMDLTPRGTLIDYLEKCFPVTQYETYNDEEGNLRSRPVFDSKGNAVLNKEAVRKRDQLIAHVNEMSIPDSPLDMLFNEFGTGMVAEVTGRTRRVVPKVDENGREQRMEESRTEKSKAADIEAFQNGDKRILVFNNAGGTGKSYHADLKAKNQQQRVHYVLQPGWEASKAVQGFGRTNRSNQANAPIYKLVTTDIKGQKRFTSTIARRLDQLGALTKGQRDTGSGSMFGAKDNLETELARDSLREFYNRLVKNTLPGIDGKDVITKMGLLRNFSDEYGNLKMDEVTARDISKFLNRILALEIDEQNMVFDSFLDIYSTNMEDAIRNGTLDTGMENVKADKIEVLDDKVIRKDDKTGDATHYIQAKTYTKPTILSLSDVKNVRGGFIGLYRTEDGVRAVFKAADKTNSYGVVQKQFRLVSPNKSAAYRTSNENSLKRNASAIPEVEWETAWNEEIKKIPEYNEDTIHMLTGSLLPVWNMLPQTGVAKVKRLIAADGKMYLGRVIGNTEIDNVLSRFSVARTMEKVTGEKVMSSAIRDGVHYQLMNNRAEIYRSRVSGEWRLEYYQPMNTYMISKRYPGMINEYIGYRSRFFIPSGESGVKILDEILKDNPVKNSYTDEERVQYQNRTDTLTDTDILELAATEIPVDNLDAAQADALNIFKKRLGTLRSLMAERKELGSTYKEQQFGENGDRNKAAETLEKIHSLDERIKEAETKVLNAETSPALKKVLHIARRIVEQQQKSKDDNAVAIKKYRDRITKDVNDISNWVINPSNKTDMKHVPDVLKSTVIPFITSIDLTSKRQLRGGDATRADREFMKRLSAVQDALKQNIETNGLYSGYSDLPPDFMERLQDFIDAAQEIVNSNSGQFVINKMTAAEMKELADIVTKLKNLIKDFNSFHANAVYQHVYEAGDATIQELGAYQDAKSMSKTGEAMNNFVFWQQIRPAYAFERFGSGGKAIYDGLRRGQAKLAFNTKEIVDFSEAAYTAQEVKDWENTVRSIKIGDKTVQMKVSQIMSFYELLKREQAKGHIFGQGIRIASFRDGKELLSDVGHTITIDDANRIISVLTDRQIEVADKLQQFMQEKGGEWGNYVSVKRFGEKLFGEEHYFPINSDGRHLEANADENPSAASLYALLNMGFTKKLQEKANNRIALYSIFDVFSNHMAGVAQYNALALPVLDALKWFNYQQKKDVIVMENGSEHVIHEVKDSVRDQLNRVYGVTEETRPGSGKRGYAENFIVGILKAFNGTETQGISSDSVGLNALRHYNMAQVAFNLRVVVQQPLAITRAAMLIDYSSIMKGMWHSSKDRQKTIAEMRKYSGIAAWKGLGFYDTNISRGLTDIIKHDETFRDKLGEFGMKGAEFADDATWAAMWSACKEEVEKKYKIHPGDKHFFDVVTNLFEDIVYKTQVVDSVLTKNEYLRSKGFFARATGSFMSEPTTTASMLADAFDKYRMDLQKGMTKRQAWEKNAANIGRTAYVYGIGAVILAAVQAVADAFRDDDKYEGLGDKWQEAFIGNFIDELMPMNKLPLVSDFYDLAKELLSVIGDDTYGYNPSSVWMQWYDSLVKGTEIIYKKITGDKKNKYTWYGGIYKLLQAVSGMTGLPIAAFTREAVVSWNNTVGWMAPSYLVRTYEQNPETEIKSTFMNGHISTEEARRALVADALMSEEKAAELVAALEFKRNNPEYRDDDEYSIASVSSYLEYAQEENVDAGTFFRAWKFNSKTVADKDENGKAINDSKRKKVVAYIDSLFLTKKQKDSLYYAFGYSKDKIKNTPWH